VVSTEERVDSYPVFLGMTRPAMKLGITFGSFLALSMATVLTFVFTSSLWSVALFIAGYGPCYALCQRHPHIFSMLRVRLWETWGLPSAFWGSKGYSPSLPRLSKHARRKLKHDAQLRRERSLEKFIPYASLVDAHTVSLKDGGHLQVLELAGMAFETRDVSELNYRTRVFNTLIRSLGPRFALTHHVIRRRVRPKLPGRFEPGFAAELNARWQSRLDERALYENVHYLTVIQRTALSSAGALGREAQRVAVRLDPAAVQSRRESDLKSLEDAVSSILATLAPYRVRRLGMSESPEGRFSEVLGFLSELLHGERRRIRLTPLPLDRYLGAKRFLFGSEVLEIRGAVHSDVRLGAMLTLKEYAPEAYPGVFDALLRVSCEVQITQSAALVSRQRALNALKLQQRQMRTAEDDAVTLEEQLGEARDALASGQLVFAEHHWSVLVTGGTREELDESISEVASALGDVGVIAERSDLTLEADYWAQLPGNFPMIARRALVSSACLACFTGFHGFARGETRGHWGPAVTVLETTSASPYSFQFHDRDMGHFTLIGPSGSGKTVLLNFLLAQSQGLPRPPRIVLLDKDRGSEIFIRALGGAYRVLRPGEPSGLNPFALPDSPRTRALLCDLLGRMVQPRDGRPLRGGDRTLLAEAVDTLYASPPERRSLASVEALLEGAELRPEDGLLERLRPWVGEGERAWVFSGSAPDPFAHHSVGFDLTQVLGDPAVREVLVGYLFHRLDALFDGNPTLAIFEEAWRYMDDPLCAPQAKDWLKTLRKRNGVIGFCSQSAQDVASSSIADSVIEQSPTQIWLPNPRATEQSSCGSWGLTRTELEYIRTFPDTGRCFLLKRGHQSVVSRLDLSGMDDLICVLSGREESVAQLDGLRAELGDDPAAWLPRFRGLRPGPSRPHSENRLEPVSHT